MLSVVCVYLGFFVVCVSTEHCINRKQCEKEKGQID
jgi:hypothetical protein